MFQIPMQVLGWLLDPLHFTNNYNLLAVNSGYQPILKAHMPDLTLLESGSISYYSHPGR